MRRDSCAEEVKGIRRKIIEIAGSTQLISLPKKWSEKHQLQKGHELEITEKENHLIVHTNNVDHSQQKSKSLRIDGKEHYLKDILQALYQKGYTEVTLKYRKRALSATVQQILHKEMIGFELVEQKPHSCRIRVVTDPVQEQFNPLLKRAHSLVISMFGEIMETLTEGELSLLDSVMYQEINNNRYTMFCKRLINRGEFNEGYTNYYYIFVQTIERLGHEMKLMCDHIKRMGSVEGLDEELKRLGEEIQEALQESYELFYHFDLDQVFKHFEKRRTIIKRCQAAAARIRSGQVRLIHYYINIIEHTHDLMEARFQLEI